ncbi:MAG: HyaD/HybD family hydrogenase maturation endopeptidase [Gammaproteobacteria bacterium]|nr:HyaD/HybD family hydrogenase maturation endopeptidase [Gammaproteobacteria bacterium]
MHDRSGHRRRFFVQTSIFDYIACRDPHIDAGQFLPARVDPGQYGRRSDVLDCRKTRRRGVVAVEVAQHHRADRVRDSVADTAADTAAHILVLGLGNVLLTDDGVGVRLIERLQRQPPADGVSFVDGGTLSFSLLAHVETAGAMLVVDAADLGQAPGAVRVFENQAMDHFLASSRRRSVHEVGLIDLLDMARLLDCLPRRRALLCVQPAVIAWGESFSPPVAGAFDAACARADAVLRGWCRP